ncbi:MAG TPA: GNAT family N-acetyltransferase [Patescibacteria group bacterium]|nr:GNAT family N-acetyltransferase [Patescibacteria group bacterium]
MIRQDKKAIAVAKTYNPKRIAWGKIKRAILKIEADAFHQYDPQAHILESDFTNKKNVVLLLRTIAGRIIGYAYAERLKPGTAYLTSIAIHPRFQGKGLAKNLHSMLNRQLRKQGYTFLEGHVLHDGYLHSLQKMYADRIVSKRKVKNDNEMRHFIRIRLD